MCAALAVVLAVIAASRISRRLTAADDFDAAWARLKAGRSYTKQPTGRREFGAVVHGIRVMNVVEVPDDYDPSRTWPLRMSLHGGVSRPAPAPGVASDPRLSR